MTFCVYRLTSSTYKTTFSGVHAISRFKGDITYKVQVDVVHQISILVREGNSLTAFVTIVRTFVPFSIEVFIYRVTRNGISRHMNNGPNTHLKTFTVTGQGIFCRNDVTVATMCRSLFIAV